MRFNLETLDIGGYIDIGNGFELILDIDFNKKKILVRDIWYESNKITRFKENKNIIEVIGILKKAYPENTKVQLKKMEDPFAVPVDTKGIVKDIDDMAQIHVSWETGSSLAVVYGEDKIIKCI